MAKRTRAQDEATAYHEAGHAVVAILERMRIRRATINPEPGSDGHVLGSSLFRHGENTYEITPRMRLKVERLIRFSLAGEIAQRRFRPRSLRSHHGRDDHQAAYETAAHITGSDRQAAALINFLAIQTEEMIAGYWPAIEAIGGALLERRVLTGEEVREVFFSAMGVNVKSAAWAKGRA